MVPNQIDKRRNIILLQTHQARKLDNVIGFPLEFEHGAQVWPKKCTAYTAASDYKSFHMTTASERRSLNGDDHVSNCHNMRMSPSQCEM